MVPLSQSWCIWNYFENIWYWALHKYLLIVFFYNLSVFKKIVLISIGNKFCERARNCRSNWKRMGILSLTFLPTSNRKQFWEEPSLSFSFFLYLSLSISFLHFFSFFFLSLHIELAYNIYGLFITFYLLFIWSVFIHLCFYFLFVSFSVVVSVSTSFSLFSFGRFR